MDAQSILGVVVQYGLPTVLLFAVGWVLFQRQKAWDIERKELYQKIEDGVNQRVADAREYNTMASSMNEHSNRGTEAINRIVGEWQKWQDHDRARELREVERERDRDLRSTGSHRAVDTEKGKR